jgi:hypothetical protein
MAGRKPRTFFLLLSLFIVVFEKHLFSCNLTVCIFLPFVCPLIVFDVLFITKILFSETKAAEKPYPVKIYPCVEFFNPASSVFRIRVSRTRQQVSEINYKGVDIFKYPLSNGHRNGYPLFY